VPRYPRLKEWAYAGIFFDLTGAAASCAAVGGYGAYAFHVVAPLILTGFTVASKLPITPFFRALRRRVSFDNSNLPEPCVAGSSGLIFPYEAEK
jgi:hypothetical protein